mgnify:CR=1 FL=1
MNYEILKMEVADAVATVGVHVARAGGGNQPD